MVDLNRPRRGSMAFRPRKRAAQQNARVYWQESNVKRILGFPGYKAGMTHVSHIDDTQSPSKGQEVLSAATIVEVPPVFVYGYRAYGTDGNSLGDELVSDEKTLKALHIKKIHATPSFKPEDIANVRLLVFSQPSRTGIGKKHVERMELGLGGQSATEKLEYAKSLLGKELKVSEVFKSGEFVDIISVTKGKGWQGAVKRFGISIQRRKATGKRRHVGTLGQWHPAYVLYTVPQAGQMGYHTRTELNKLIMKIGSTVDEVNPPEGFLNYGFVKNDYVVVRGSIPGPSKRLVKLRLSVRKDTAQKEPSILSIAQ